MNIESIRTRLSDCAVERLKSAGLFSIEGLLKTSPRELRALRYFGQTTTTRTICAIAEEMGHKVLFDDFSRWHQSDASMEEIVRIVCGDSPKTTPARAEHEAANTRLENRILGALRGESRCDRCRFWNQLDPVTTGVAEGQGECRRRAPVAHVQLTGEPMSPETSWALTFDNEWCGEFEPKP